jgi:RNA polymerase sigma factor (sigma-70 family)
MPVREGTRRQPSELSDALLAQQSLAGDQRAFETLVQRYSTALFTFICRFLGDDDQACDILQQVFLQLSLSLPTLRIDDPLKSWLFLVARNRCRDEVRRKRAVHFSELGWVNDDDEVSPLTTLLDPDPLPEEWVERRDLQACLQQAMLALPPTFRAVVLLRYAAQFSFAEISQVLQTPEATAKTYFQRAKPLLRATLTVRA